MSAVNRTARDVMFGGAATAIIALASGSGPARAQDAPHSQQAQASPVLGDIVVTARRRSENLQDVPVAITALTGASLEERNISDVLALDGIAPNVKVVASASNTTSYIQIRGSVTLNPNPGYEPAAAMYVDGIYIGKSVGSTMEIADIEHIEVLRGPQGTLFGRNTLAGAINIVTRKPSGEWGGSVKLGVGNYDRRLGQATLDLPSFGNLAIKLSGLWSEREGYIKARANPYSQIPSSPPTVKRIGDEESQALRGAVRFTPTDDLTFDYTIDYNRVRNTPLAGVLQSVGENGIFDPASPSYIGVPLYLYVQTGSRPRDYYGTAGPDGQKLFETMDSTMHTLTAAWDVGGATIKSITGYREMDWGQSLDLDASPLPLAAAGSDLDYRQFSEELQVSGTAGRLTYTAGLYYFNDKGDLLNPQQFFGATMDSWALFKTDAYALYGQVDYTPPILNDNLILTAGFRYSHEKKSVERSASSAGFITIPDGTRAEETFKGSTPTFIAKYAFSPDFNIYAKYAEGFKSGGFSTDAATIEAAVTPYDPETVKSWEFGAKTRLLDGQILLNVAAYFDKHHDQQISVFSPSAEGFVTRTANGARSKIQGFEVELQAQLVDGVRINGNVGYTDAKFLDYFPVVGGPDAGNSYAFAFVPKWTASAGFEAQLYDSDNAVVTLAADLSHSSGYSSLPYSKDPAVDPNIYSTQVGALTTVDARLIVSDIPVGNSALQATLFGKNLFNAAERTAGIDFGAAFGNIVTRNYNWPRTWGLDLTLKF